MSTCAYCNTPIGKRDFTCGVCGKSFCRVHVGSNEKYACPKCGARHSRETALKFNDMCPQIPQSTCPKCAATLRLDRLPAGQTFLTCSRCSWNSFDSQPMICYQSETVVLKEALKVGLVRSTKTCGTKLRKTQGTDFCPNCAMNFIKAAGTVSFSSIGKQVGMDDDGDVLQLLQGFTREQNLTGYIDEQNKMFTYIDPGFRARVIEQVKTDGYISVSALASNLGIEADHALKLMYEIIRTDRLRGTFSREKKFYYSAKYLQDQLVAMAKESGEIKLEDVSKKFDVHPDIIKDNLITLLKTKDIDGYFGEKGAKVYTRERLMTLIQQYAEQKHKFKLEDVAGTYNIALELVRSTIHELVKVGRIRGVFTQKREYVTDDALRDDIMQIVVAYRTITLAELSRRLAITEKTVEESLAALIARGDIAGFIDLRTREFKMEPKEGAKPATAQAARAATSAKVVEAGEEEVLGEDSAAAPAAYDESFVEVVREYDFVGGQVHFKVAIRNNSAAAIFDIKVVIDYPDAFSSQDEMITVPVIEPNSSRGVDFFLEPTTCGKSQVGATVIYKDYTSKAHTVHVEPKEVWIKCPLVVATLDTINDVNQVIESMASDARSFLISDVDARLAYHAGFRAISHFDARCVHAPEKMDGDNFEAEAWFATKVKVGGGRIVIKLAVSEKSQIMEIRVWCADAGQLTGLLAKIIEYLFSEINTIRKITDDSREKTIDLMAIAQGITVLSDYSMLKWKYGDISNKLEDIYARLQKFLKSDPVLDEMKSWLDKLREHDEEENLSEEVSEDLSPAIERWHEAITRKVAPQ
jgi:DNA-directed RNA polymerase subunit M/transcription elongation factor TFIIS